MDYRPITDDELDEFQEAVTSGATREQSRRLLAELRRADAGALWRTAPARVGKTTCARFTEEIKRWSG
jgi:hypothetical protein